MATARNATGQYHTTIDRCTLVMRPHNHSECCPQVVQVVQGELLAKIDDDTDTVLGFCSNGVSFTENFGYKGSDQPFFVSENWDRLLSFIWYRNVGTSFFRFVTMHASDRQTDRYTERLKGLGNTVCCITCSHAVKTNKTPTLLRMCLCVMCVCV